jgi:Ca2+-binding EF-hand superfamily protein
MGCFADKESFADEENALEVESTALGFGKVSVNELDVTVRKYSCGIKINRNQCKSLCQALGLSLSNYDTHIYIKRLVDKIKVQGQDFFDANSLLAIGIMLANGELHSKARVLFETADREETGAIDNTKLETVLNLWVDSVLVLGLLVGDGQNHQSNDKRNRAYLAKCQDNKSRWVSFMLAKVGSGVVTKDHFISVTTAQNDGSFFSPRYFRIHLASDQGVRPRPSLTS